MKEIQIVELWPTMSKERLKYHWLGRYEVEHELPPPPEFSEEVIHMMKDYMKDFFGLKKP